MTLLKKMIRDQLLGPNYDSTVLPIIAKHNALMSEYNNNFTILKPIYDELKNLFNTGKFTAEELINNTQTFIEGESPSEKQIFNHFTSLWQKDSSELLSNWSTNFKKAVGPDGNTTFTDGNNFYYLNELPFLKYDDIKDNSSKFVGKTNMPFINGVKIFKHTATIATLKNSRGDVTRRIFKEYTYEIPVKYIIKDKYIQAARYFGVKLPNGVNIISPEKMPDIRTSLPKEYIGLNAYLLLHSFNFLISVINHYEKYQTTGILFTNPNDRDVQTSILSGNVLKALTSQARFLVPNGQNLVNYNSTIAGKAGIDQSLAQFIWVCTMGYLKSGDIIVSSLQKYFSSNETYAQVIERMRAMGTNQTSDGFFTPPSFLHNVMGTDWNHTSMPTGKMVTKVINDCLIEAENFYRLIFPNITTSSVEIITSPTKDATPAASYI